MSLPTSAEFNAPTVTEQDFKAALTKLLNYLSEEVPTNFLLQDSITPFTSGVNIIDPTRFIQGKYYDYTTGNLADNPDFVAAGLYKVDQQTAYKVPESYGQQYAFFDKDLNFLSGEIRPNPLGTINTPINAAYIGISITPAELPNFMMTKVLDRIYDFRPYVQYAKQLRIDVTQIDNLISQVLQGLGMYSINIIDPSKLLDGHYIEYNTGKEPAIVGFNVAGPYPVKPSTEYQVNADYTQQFAFFDSKMKYISGLVNAGSSHKFTTPANAAYIKLTIESNKVSTTIVSESSKYPALYEPFNLRFNAVSIDASQVDSLKQFISTLLALEPINIIDPTKAQTDKYVNWQNGQIGAVATYSALGPYKVEPNTEYKVSNSYDQQFAFYDSSMVYISGAANAGSSKKFTTPANAVYAMFTVKTANMGSLVIAKSENFPDSYVPNSVVFANNLSIKTAQILDFYSKLSNYIGAEAINIVDKTKIINDSYVDYTTGNIAFNTAYYAAGPYEVTPSTQYKTTANFYQQFAFYDANMVYISGLPYPASDKTFTTPANAKYIRLSIDKSILDSVMVAKSSIFPSRYLSNDVKLAKNIYVEGQTVNTTEIWVSANLADTESRVKFKGPNAIQLAINSISDASPINRYVIRAKKGIYKVDKASDFIGYPGYPAMIEMKDYVDIVGQGEYNTIIWAELPYDDNAIGPSADGNTYPRLQYQTIYHYAKDAHVKDLTFVAKNLRYTLHQDNPKGSYSDHKYHNVGFVYKGDRGALNPLGIGTWPGENTYLFGGRAHSDIGHPFACHNNTAFDTPSGWFFENFNFSSITNKYGILMQNDGSLLDDKLQLVGCSFGGIAYILAYVDIWLTGNTNNNFDSFNHAEWKIFGHGNEPFLFSNQVSTGQCLRFKSTATGQGKTIRIDKTSSAYPILIKNNQANAESAIYLDTREFIDGYIAQDGSLGLPAYAFGCKDLTDGAYLYDQGTKYTSLGVRLGDCTSNPKQLKLTVDGVLNTINFNQNYSGMSNSQIISLINAQLTNVSADIYVYGREYYPTITDVCETVYNFNDSPGATQAYIPKGSLVTKNKGTVKIANGDDPIYGVALDDIPVMYTTSEGVRKGQGRVMKKGYISFNQNEAHFVLNISPVVSDPEDPENGIQRSSIGTRFSVSNGKLLEDVNGKIHINIDTGIVSINC